MKCPKCGSGHVDAVEEQGVMCIICLNCGYDESEELAGVPSEKGTKYKAMKTGGPTRTQKR
ncbi:MAG: hypothetical protein QW331_01945 [Candidatus Woesearchaeota archaeon]